MMHDNDMFMYYNATYIIYCWIVALTAAGC